MPAPRVRKDSIPETNVSLSGFEHQLSSLNVPAGPSYYAARRSLWLSPQSTTAPDCRPKATSITKLEDMLDNPTALRSGKVWNSGLGRVWKGLMEGGRAKYNIPLPVLVKILYAVWIRDGTWPPGAEAPPDEAASTLS